MQWKGAAATWSGREGGGVMRWRRLREQPRPSYRVCSLGAEKKMDGVAPGIGMASAYRRVVEGISVVPIKDVLFESYCAVGDDVLLSRQ